MLDSETATFQGACGVAFRLLEPVEEDDGWKLRASNIEPWRAERYGNAGIYIKEKYDSYQKKFFQEMKVMTRNKILTYACYGDLNFVTSGTFKKLMRPITLWGRLPWQNLKIIRIVIVILK